MNSITGENSSALEAVPDRLQFHTVLAPVDFSDASVRAFRYAARIAEKYGARIIALHVVENSLGYYGFDATVGDALVSEAQQRLDKICREAKVHPECVETIVRLPVDSVAKEIVLAARDLAADLIVMPANQHAGFAFGLIPNTADRIGHHAPCPVLFVPPPIPAGGKV